MRSINKQSLRATINSTRELKNIAVATSYADTVAGVVNPLSQQIVQGDTVNSRSGDSITPVKLDINLSLLSGVGSTQSFHRVLVFQDRFNQGTLPAVTDILDGGLFDSTYTIRNRQQQRFKILYDKMHGVVGGSNSAATHVQLHLKPKGPIYFNGITNTNAANGPQSIFLITLTDSITVSTATVAFYASLFYHDS